MWQTTFSGNYSKFDSRMVSVPTTGPLGSLPQPIASLKGNCEKILVQAHPNNPGNVVIGQGANLAANGSAGGFIIPPGGMQDLPDNNYAVWSHIATLAGCNLIVTYVSGPK